jgi:signal transduction histidine kinase
MTIKFRFALLLGLLLGGLAAAHLVLRQLEISAARDMAAAERLARSQLLHHWIEATSRSLPQFASEVAQSDELGALLREGSADAARSRLAGSLEAAGVAWLWVVHEDGRPAFDAAATGVARIEQPPVAPADFATLVRQTPNPRFFAELDQAFVEICVRRWQAANATAPAGWIVVARPWDDRQLAALADLTESKVALVAPHAAAREPGTGQPIELVRPLFDWRGQTLRVLTLSHEASDITHVLRTSSQQSLVIVVFGLLLLLGFGWALHVWVLRPLRLIGTSLADQSPGPVAALSTENSELGRVAQLAISSFDQRAALEREIAERRTAQAALERSEASLRRNLDERARLGRDLHDGVIQSLYAAGMGLAGIRMQLKPEQTEAATRLEQTRAVLNETIHDVRNFIIGLEPEALKLQTFSQAIAALLDVMRSMRAFHSSVKVDEELATCLTLAQRVHALQIAREAVSNALRHGHATEIEVNLQRRGEFAAFEVIDNGRGFDPAAVSAGKGLANFSERARELGAELAIDSQPGHGTCVKLTFSLTL